MARRRDSAWPVLTIGTGMASLGAAVGGFLALAYRPTGLAYADALVLCGPASGDAAVCLTDATRTVGLLMVAGAAVALGVGLACVTLAGLGDTARSARHGRAHPLVDVRFAELCRQYGLRAADLPALRVGGQRVESVRAVAGQAMVVVPAALGRAPLRPAAFDPVVRVELNRIATGRTGWASCLRGWPWLITPVCAGLAGVVGLAGSTLAVPLSASVRLVLLAAVVAGLSIGLRGLGRGRPGLRRIASWYAGGATGAAASIGAMGAASVVWHLDPSAGPPLIVAATAAMVVTVGLLGVLLAGRSGVLGARPRLGNAVLGALAGLLVGATVFPIGFGAAPGAAATMLARPPVGVVDPPARHRAPTAGPSDTGSDEPRVPAGPPGASTPAASASRQPAASPVTAGVDTDVANRVARVIEQVLDPTWRADPLPEPPPSWARPAGCHPSIIESYLRSGMAHRTGHGVARYATSGPAGSDSLSRITLQIDVVSYREPVDLVFAAANRTAIACREFTDEPSGLRVQAVTRPAPSAGDRAWRVDLVQTLGRGAGRVTATTALGLAQVDTTVVVVTMTASLTPVDGSLFDETMLRTTAELAGRRHDPAPGIDHLDRSHSVTFQCALVSI
ncbi:hypothetical protein [Micromonospora sp. NBC_01813]|uniref:hypothetical protein n=1 Tax=Micromonospora sp. NBC_01813 TaxID=2975988 RepID=UPI002DD84DA0|nr:hypothetical protein [Micromonospora sp. NBC_01813]WSA10425.1 hypothetical protein OG958_06445 [Micromonospora sp. NBC_01813]